MFFYALITRSANGTYLMGEVAGQLSDLNLHEARGSYLAMLSFGAIRQGSLNIQDTREILYGGRLGNRPTEPLLIVNGMNN